jgi:hypothetical protein
VDGGESMKKEHSVFITIAGEELAQLINREVRRKGLLKNVKSTVEYELFDKDQEVSVEYKWEEKL